MKGLLSQLIPNHRTRLTNKFCPKFRIAQRALLVLKFLGLDYPKRCLK
jgi:hypothetical protein